MRCGAGKVHDVRLGRRHHQRSRPHAHGREHATRSTRSCFDLGPVPAVAHSTSLIVTSSRGSALRRPRANSRASEEASANQNGRRDPGAQVLLVDRRRDRRRAGRRHPDGGASEVGYEVYLNDASNGVEVYEAIMEGGRKYNIRATDPCGMRRIVWRPGGANDNPDACSWHNRISRRGGQLQLRARGP
jgi:hypothetical protein